MHPLIKLFTSELSGCMKAVAGRANDRHSGCGVRAFIQKKYKNNVSKGVKVSKINRGSGVLVVLRGL